MEQFAKGLRFPRSMLNGPANARLLEALGVEIVDEWDAELEDFARGWLLTVLAKAALLRQDRPRGGCVRHSSESAGRGQQLESRRWL
jgi:hypothetical protein